MPTRSCSTKMVKTEPIVQAPPSTVKVSVQKKHKLKSAIAQLGFSNRAANILPCIRHEHPLQSAVNG